MSVKLKMNEIIFIGNFLSRHGINPTYTESLVTHLKQTGMQIRTASDKKNIVIRLIDMTLITLKARPYKSIIIIDLYSGKRALIYAQWIGYICRKKKVSYCVVLHGGNLPAILKNNPRKISHLLAGAKKIISPSAYLAKEFSSYLQIQIIPNAIDVEKYHFELKKEIKPRILFLRSFHKLTRPQDALFTLKELLPTFPDACLTMAGGDEDGTLAECKELISNLHLDEQIRITGKLSKEEIYHLSNEHDIFLHTMEIDNMPITILEAMALGLCIVATEVGGIPFILENNKNAQIVKVGDVEGMVKAIKKYLTNYRYSLAISEQARQDVEKYDWKNILPKWIRLFNEVNL